jgi:hypothetical protein
MSGAFVTVSYSCHLCGIEKREVRVRARGDEDVVQWLEQTCMVDLGADHAAMSPHCHPTELKDIMIPITGTDKIGGVVKQ